MVTSFVFVLELNSDEPILHEGHTGIFSSSRPIKGTVSEGICPKIS